MSNIISLFSNNRQITFQRQEDGYINATALCNNVNKSIGSYLRNKTTEDFLKELEADMQIRITELVQVKQGGEPHLQGTWIHPQVAINLAQWLSPKFAVQVSKWVQDWITKKQTPTHQLSRLEILQIAIENEKKVLELQNTVSEQQTTIENRDKTIFDIANIQDTYSLREASKNLIVGEKILQEYMKSKKWWIYLSDGSTTKKMYSTSYAKDNNFAIDKPVLNKARQKFYHQFRITKHGMDFLIKKRQEIVK